MISFKVMIDLLIFLIVLYFFLDVTGLLVFSYEVSVFMSINMSINICFICCLCLVAK